MLVGKALVSVSTAPNGVSAGPAGRIAFRAVIAEAGMRDALKSAIVPIAIKGFNDNSKFMLAMGYGKVRQRSGTLKRRWA
jgi:hypothetical protein